MAEKGVKVEEKFEEMDWKKIKDKDFDLLATDELKREILTKIGYKIDGEGYLINEKTGQRVLAEDKKEINLDEDREVALLKGSHIFVRNVAGYSQVLTEKGLIKVRKTEAEEKR